MAPHPRMTYDVVAVVGPTAVGKSAVGVELARALGGEVVNADSMQLYRGMDIGTAKLTPAERGGVPHHLLDVLDVRETSTVAGYQRLAREAIDEVRARGVTAVLVGGSGLYVQAALDALDFPGSDPAIRAELEAQLAAVGAEALHDRLAAADPLAASRIHPSNGRRTVRALEVITATGRRYSDSGPGMTAYQAVYPVRLLGLDSETPVLDQRIAERVDRMWALGLVDEVRALAAAGLRDGVTARRALGYAQALAMLDGEYDEAAARQRTVQATRRFVRRQRSWFRRDPRITWSATPDELLELARP
ncbi:MAG TPA: tRNA (adenosine(37)-N6)-dimethylallyltransferase MiaA [Mycobacteriales bacterium]|nr:tRNA (adenosine(37)-N6)-dimethylallyltransferase MiaA [Mycobacteriales bacterium]